MQIELPKGIWSVMLTPYNKDNRVDYRALSQLIEWYIANGVTGLFAVCQSSEMFALSLEERVDISKFVVEHVNGRVPVVASGNISDSIEDQIRELDAIAATGVDAVVIVTNRFASEDESDDVWIANMEQVLAGIKGNYPLGIYECPYPYKRVLSPKLAKWAVESNRFSFLKDTSCDLKSISTKLNIFKGSGIQLYNANTSTLKDSLKLGAAGYCGVMANFHPKLYVHLYENYMADNAEKLSDELTMLSLIEKQVYPVNAKYYLQNEGIQITTLSRVRDNSQFTPVFMEEIEMLRRITKRMYREYLVK